MSGTTALNAVTQFVEADGNRYAYRELGEGNVPIVLFNRFRGQLDDWDPVFLDKLSANRHVIYFDNAGVGRSEGTFPDKIQDAARNAIAIVTTLGYSKVDLLGFSMGSYVAQSFTTQRPDLVRKLVLTGSGARSRAGSWTPEVTAAVRREEILDSDHVFLFFKPTKTSTEAGWAYIARTKERTEDRDVSVTSETRGQQLKAMGAWAASSDEVAANLRIIGVPVLVANGDNDIMIGTDNTIDLANLIPFSQTEIFPDSGHGFLFQYPEIFASHVNDFLSHDYAVPARS